ncbi:17425_t:CDS:2 [Cetraspora pellucida]|uniref:17425_t:CDS:1 n=1 Tax=Cetraspora pellucida TaxID=1433469 RepID=A0A9N9H4D4_9GLOM|nr:17425_t:CDS:2 [Cetraspora pellucida]
MGVPSRKARCCIPSQSSIITSFSFYTSPTVLAEVPVSTSVPVRVPTSVPTSLLVSSSNPTSPTDLSITSSPFPSSISTLAPDIPKTISTSPTGIVSSTNNTTIANGYLPIIISISIFSTLLIGALMFAYIRSRHKRQRQNALATAIIAAEAGLDDNGIRVAISQPRSPPRYKISTLQIEPMTRRLTMNLHQKGKSIVVNDDNDVDTDHVVNVVSISEVVLENRQNENLNFGNLFSISS